MLCSLVRFIALCSLCMYVLYIRKYKLFFIVKKEATLEPRRPVGKYVLFLFIYFFTQKHFHYFSIKYENSFDWVVLFKITLNFILDINELTKKWGQNSVYLHMTLFYERPARILIRRCGRQMDAFKTFLVLGRIGKNSNEILI